MNIVEQKLIPGPGWNLLEGPERIGTQLFLVADAPGREEPGGIDKQFMESLVLLLGKFKDHMGLMDDGRVNFAKSIIKPGLSGDHRRADRWR